MKKKKLLLFDDFLFENKNGEREKEKEKRDLFYLDFVFLDLEFLIII